MADVARALRVSRQSVSRWYRQWRQGGVAALRGAGRAGRKPRLEQTDLRRVEAALHQGAQAHGFDTDLWTLPRVAIVIERVTGVRYHSGHVWKVLRGLGWTLQRPARQARERNERAVRRWVTHRWPAVKKRATLEGLDLLPRREWDLAAAIRPQDLGAERADPHPDPQLQLEEAVGVRRAGLSVGWPALSALVSHAPGELHDGKPDRLPEGAEATPARAEGHPGVGRAACSHESEDARLVVESMPMAPRRMAARVRTRAESAGAAVGQRQRPGTRQPLRG